MSGTRQPGLSGWLRQFAAIFGAEMRYLIKSKICLINIGVPVAFALLFGCVYTYNVVNDIPLCIYDEEQSNVSRQIITAFGDSDRFTITAYVQSEEEMREAIYSGEARAALEIPQDFSKDFKTGDTADIMLMVDSANNMFGNAAIAAAQEIARSLCVSVANSVMQSAGLLPQEALNTVYPVRLGVRILGNPVNGYTEFMLGGLMLNGLQIGLMLALAPLLITELQRRQWPSVPVWLLLPAKVIPYILWSLVGFTIAMLICIYVFAVPMVGNWLDAFIDATGFLLFVAGALMLFSACSPSRPLSLQIPMLYIMPGVLYSGLSWPTFDMSSYAYMFGSLLPMSYSGDVLRDIMLNGYSPDLWPNLGCMLLGCLIPGSLGGLIFAIRRHFREKHRAAATAGEVS